MWAGTTRIAFSLLICPCSKLYSKKKKEREERKKKSKLKPTARAAMTAEIKRTKIPCSLANWIFVWHSRRPMRNKSKSPEDFLKSLLSYYRCLPPPRYFSLLHFFLPGMQIYGWRRSSHLVIIKWSWIVKPYTKVLVERKAESSYRLVVSWSYCTSQSWMANLWIQEKEKHLADRGI